ncbi:hypothetical protein SAMN02745220_04127 [Desulfopila aestuarii DSM 18488]|uniref:Uncharacterized protein n=1 Tax=Desulfopila aestuarii DSM 18488 TaxID=1121416 RepID=A0A1M7YGE6_9BACT|nr:hypothetical protein SAMN02745220_04127 [Desulfopila aestuarii DSM 18488]
MDYLACPDSHHETDRFIGCIVAHIQYGFQFLRAFNIELKWSYIGKLEM